MDLPKKPDVICTCSGTTKQQIQALLTKGVTDPDRISRITGACSGCGACDPEILKFIAENSK